MADNSTALEANKRIELEIEQVTDIDSLINDDIEILDTDDIKAGGIRTGYLPLLSGRALSLQNTYSVMALENTVMVVLIGPSESGKTTIETTLYQLFQRGSVLRHMFAGSKTIQAYEERSFYTRVNSHEDIASTPRTPRGTHEVFLHLRLFDEIEKRITNYLFADLSGEEIQIHLADVDSLKQNLPFIGHTNNYTIILDGDRLSQKHQRNGVIEETSTMLRTIFDAGLYTSHTKVQIVISKYDIIEKKSDPTTAQYLERNIQELRTLISRYLTNISIHQVAAMPKNSNFEVGYGLDTLLDAWKYVPSYTLIDTTYNVEYVLKDEFNKLRYKLAGDANG